jgi:hypothetical protein
MTPQEFCYWLQGFFELSDSEDLTQAQTISIKNHLNLVFHHSIDPSYGGNQEEAQAIHDGKPPFPNHLTFPNKITARC